MLLILVLVATRETKRLLTKFRGLRVWQELQLLSQWTLERLLNSRRSTSKSAHTRNTPCLYVTLILSICGCLNRHTWTEGEASTSSEMLKPCTSWLNSIARARRRFQKRARILSPKIMQRNKTSWQLRQLQMTLIKRTSYLTQKMKKYNRCYKELQRLPPLLKSSLRSLR